MIRRGKSARFMRRGSQEPRGSKSYRVFDTGPEWSSRLARASWIEIVLDNVQVMQALLSRLARASWIEIPMKEYPGTYRRRSRLARASWIEILSYSEICFFADVEARKSLVDRNIEGWHILGKVAVVEARKSLVDRNF